MSAPQPHAPPSAPPNHHLTPVRINGQLILQEDYDNDYDYSDAEVLDYAVGILGLDPVADVDLLWVAEEAIHQPLPRQWKPVQDDETGSVYYFNFNSGESRWDHPVDSHYRDLVAKEREKMNMSQRAASSKGTRQVKSVPALAPSAKLKPLASGKLAPLGVSKPRMGGQLAPLQAQKSSLVAQKRASSLQSSKSTPNSPALAVRGNEKRIAKSLSPVKKPSQDHVQLDVGSGGKKFLRSTKRNKENEKGEEENILSGVKLSMSDDEDDESAKNNDEDVTPERSNTESFSGKKAVKFSIDEGDNIEYVETESESEEEEDDDDDEEDEDTGEGNPNLLVKQSFKTDLKIPKKTPPKRVEFSESEESESSVDRSTDTGFAVKQLTKTNKVNQTSALSKPKVKHIIPQSSVAVASNKPVVLTDSQVAEEKAKYEKLLEEKKEELRKEMEKNLGIYREELKKNEALERRQFEEEKNLQILRMKEDLERDYLKVDKSARDKHDSTIKNINDECERNLKQEKEKIYKEFDEKLSATRIEIEAEIEEEIKVFRSEKGLELVELKESVGNEFSKDRENVENGLKENYDEEKLKLEQEYHEKLEELKVELREKHEEEVDVLNREHFKKLEDLDRAHDMELEKKREEQQKKLAELELEYTEELREETDKLNKRMEGVKNKIICQQQHDRENEESENVEDSNNNEEKEICVDNKIEMKEDVTDGGILNGKDEGVVATNNNTNISATKQSLYSVLSEDVEALTNISERLRRQITDERKYLDDLYREKNEMLGKVREVRRNLDDKGDKLDEMKEKEVGMRRTLSGLKREVRSQRRIKHESSTTTEDDQTSVGGEMESSAARRRVRRYGANRSHTEGDTAFRAAAREYRERLRLIDSPPSRDITTSIHPYVTNQSAWSRDTEVLQSSKDFLNSKTHWMSSLGQVPESDMMMDERRTSSPTKHLAPARGYGGQQQGRWAAEPVSLSPRRDYRGRWKSDVSLGYGDDSGGRRGGGVMSADSGHPPSTTSPAHSPYHSLDDMLRERYHGYLTSDEQRSASGYHMAPITGDVGSSRPTSAAAESTAFLESSVGDVISSQRRWLLQSASKQPSSPSSSLRQHHHYESSASLPVYHRYPGTSTSTYNDGPRPPVSSQTRPVEYLLPNSGSYVTGAATSSSLSPHHIHHPTQSSPVRHPLYQAEVDVDNMKRGSGMSAVSVPNLVLNKNGKVEVRHVVKKSTAF